MIATVVFFTEECVFKGMLMGDVWVAVMCEGEREVLVRAGAQFKDVELVGHKGGSLQERAEEARLF